MPPATGRGLANWPIRRKLVALVTVPVLVIVGAGAWLTYSSVAGLRRAERTRALATTALATNVATVAVDNELNQTVLTMQTAKEGAAATGATKALQARRADTDKALATLQDYLGQPPTGGWSADVLGKASGIPLAVSALTGIRKATADRYSMLVVDKNFQGKVLKPLRDLTTSLSRDIATASAGNGQAVDQASTLNALSAASFAAATERIGGIVALEEGRLTQTGLAELQTQAVTQNAQLDIAAAHATPQQRADIAAIRGDDDRIKKFRADLDLLAANTNTALTTGGTTKITTTAASFSAATGQRVDNIDSVVGQVAQRTRDNAAADVRNALLRTGGILGLGLITLLLVFATLAGIARTVTGPMRRLRSGAVEVATVRLPAAVRQIEQQGMDANIDLPPIMPPGLLAGPETLEVAHAVDGLTAEAVRLATSQVRLRHALDEAFVSMSRRSQSMVEKQLAIIDELESTEEDPEQLRNLFRLDHLAARMRRYNDNLLVLAGSSVRTRSNTPVPVSDVFRAATSEMEQYERVRLQPVSSAAIAGPVAGGLIHLLAELLDNAAMYSPPTSPILLTAAFTPDGGMHLEVTDSGVGIPPAELAELNARLATPGTIDTQIPSRMGLFVVGRLAHRSGFEVRLSPRPSGAGTVAEVLVPAVHVVGAPSSPGAAGEAAPRLPAQVAPLPQRQPGPGLPPATPATPAPQPAGLSGRQAPPWPPAEDLPLYDGDRARNGDPAVAGPTSDNAAAGSGGLPSRVPGAALSSGPLAGGPRTDGFLQPPIEPFDAFGSADSAPPIGDPGVSPSASSATALWSHRPRSGRPGAEDTAGGGSGPGGSFLAGTPAPETDEDSFGFKPLNGHSTDNGRLGGPAEADEAAARGGWPDPAARQAPPAGPMFGSSDSPGIGLRNESPDPAPSAGGWPGVTPAWSTEPGGSGDLPRREPRRRDAGAYPGIQPAPAPAPGGAPGLFGPALRSRITDTGGMMLPIERVAPITGEISLRDLHKAGGPNPNLPPPAAQPVDLPDLPDFAAPHDPYPAEGAPDAPAVARFGSAPSGPDDDHDAAFLDPGRGAEFGTLPPPAGPGPLGTGPDRGIGGPEFFGRGGGYGDAGERGGGAGLEGFGGESSDGETISSETFGQPGAAWQGTLAPAGSPSPMEQAARDAASSRYHPADPNAPMIGSLDDTPPESATTPIFDSISMWFSDEPAAVAADSVDADAPTGEGQPAATTTDDEGERLIDLRDERMPATAGQTAAATLASRWASLGDQQWLATSARAAAGPEVAGDTSAGLPRRQPGANLLPSATSAAPAVPSAGRPVHRADADTVRGRLGSYQRGVSSARRSRQIPTGGTAAGLFTAARTAADESGHESEDHGGEQ